MVARVATRTTKAMRLDPELAGMDMPKLANAIEVYATFARAASTYRDEGRPDLADVLVTDQATKLGQAVARLVHEALGLELGPVQKQGQPKPDES